MESGWGAWVGGVRVEGQGQVHGWVGSVWGQSGVSRQGQNGESGWGDG